MVLPSRGSFGPPACCVSGVADAVSAASDVGGSAITDPGIPNVATKTPTNQKYGNRNQGNRWVATRADFDVTVSRTGGQQRFFTSVALSIGGGGFAEKAASVGAPRAFNLTKDGRLRIVAAAHLFDLHRSVPIRGPDQLTAAVEGSSISQPLRYSRPTNSFTAATLGLINFLASHSIRWPSPARIARLPTRMVSVRRPA